jgi:large subunit ribosomal protein L24
VTTEASGSFDRTRTSGRLTLKSAANSLSQLAALISPVAPALTARLERLEPQPGPAQVKFDVSLDKSAAAPDRASARASLELDAPSLKGKATVAAQTPTTAVTGFDIDTLRNAEFELDSRFTTPQARSLLVLVGLDRAVAASAGAAQVDAKLSGAIGRQLQVNAKVSGSGLDAEAQGSVEPLGAEPKAKLNLRLRNANLAPLFGIVAGDTSAQIANFSSRVTLSGNKLALDDLDSTALGSHLRGHLAVTLDAEKTVEGEVGLDTLDLAPALALALGAAGRQSGDPLTTGLLAGWRGRIGFQALKGALPGGLDVRPFSGTIKNDGQALALESLKGNIGGGTISATIDARDSAAGLSMNARVELANVDAASLNSVRLGVPKGRASLQAALSSQGRSVSALTGALAGNGTLSFDSIELTGLNPRAFEVAIRSSDSGQVADDDRLRQIVQPALSSGPLVIKAAQIPFTIRDGRLRVSATALEGINARAIVSGGFDIPADQADIRLSLTPIMTGLSGSPPEIQLFAAGPPDRRAWSVDVAPLSSWLAVRAIDRETRRLDAIERGEPPPSTAALPRLVSPEPAPEQPSAEVPMPGRDPRRVQPKPRVAPVPRPALAAPSPPIASQQIAPLPPAIEVRPAPGPPPVAPPVKPKPRPPLVLTPTNP